MIVSNIEERALKEGRSYLFFKYLKKHSLAYKNEEEYLEYLFANFYRVFFENIESVPVEKRYYIWNSHFPPEWNVTKKKLVENNYISWISLNQFLMLAQERINNPKEKFDEGLADITSNLFPEVEPETWSIILIFCLKPFGNNRIKDVIEHPWTFGKIRPYFGRRDNEDFKIKWDSQIESQKIKTFEFATILHEYTSISKDTFSKGNLNVYIDELDKLEEEYKNDLSKEAKEKEGRRVALLDIFKEMLDFLNKPELH